MYDKKMLLKWINSVDEPYVIIDLYDALYAADELGLWPDEVDSVSPEQAIMCWKIIEKVRKEIFPEELKI